MHNSLFLRGSPKQTLIDKVPEHLLLSVLTFKFDYFNFDRDTAFHQTSLGWIFDYGNIFCLIRTFWSRNSFSLSLLEMGIVL